jgi:uncharacterized membrane protein
MEIKKILSLILLFAYAMGAIGGTGYAIYSGAYLIAVAVVVLALLAFPSALACWNELNR